MATKSIRTENKLMPRRLHTSILNVLTIGVGRGWGGGCLSARGTEPPINL